MKQNLVFGLLALVLLLVLPVAALGLQPGANAQGGAAAQVPSSSVADKASAGSGEKDGEASIEVFRSATGKTESIALEEYLRGCVAAEMPLNYHEEALKAQAVACRTYALFRTREEGKKYVSDSGESDQGYLPPEERKKKWGENYEAYERKLGKVVQAVFKQELRYEGKPILAAFHAVSSGLTESAAVYWGEQFPYLQSVASPGDRLSPELSQSTVFTQAEMKTALQTLEGMVLGDDPAEWLGKATQSEAGTVTGILIGKKEYSGRQVRTALGLRSANFSVVYEKGHFTVKTTGYGHGVGMSQYGADFMARQGSDYIAILEHYYTGCTVEEVG
ncbi:MAG: stage II sporulation protein D [Oscillospiraceae bacterium]|jgi:stage II sporulation protein D|nr:stage II sporulation protein D [Oscillospiraceae bacterium]